MEHAHAHRKRALENLHQWPWCGSFAASDAKVSGTVAVAPWGARRAYGSYAADDVAQALEVAKSHDPEAEWDGYSGNLASTEGYQHRMGDSSVTTLGDEQLCAAPFLGT